MSSRWVKTGLGSWGLAVAAAGLLTASAAPGAAQTPAPAAAQAPATAAPAAEHPGKAAFEAICSNCHELAIATEQRKTQEEWNTTVQNMLNHGAPMSNEQAAQIADYLAKTYGPDNK